MTYLLEWMDGLGTADRLGLGAIAAYAGLVVLLLGWWADRLRSKRERDEWQRQNELRMNLREVQRGRTRGWP